MSRMLVDQHLGVAHHLVCIGAAWELSLMSHTQLIVYTA
jgi:hypothetical protein